MAEKKEQKVSELVYIQSHLKAPKSQRNTYGNYNFRSCEDILEAVKPLLKETNCTLVITDDIVQVADRIYVKATATLTTPSGTEYKNTAFAREASSKKGYDESQITGSASSYARKYCLNGLFCIDDNKDADALNVSPDYTAPVQHTPAQPQPQPQPVNFQQVLGEIAACTSTGALKKVWSSYPTLHTNAQFTGAMTARKDQILNNGKS